MLSGASLLDHSSGPDRYEVGVSVPQFTDTCGTTKGIRGVGAKLNLPDLVDSRPPDLPAAEGRRLRVIEGGKA